MEVDLFDRRWTSPVYRGWDAFVGDVDGDGVDEVLLGMWSETPRHDEPEPHRTVWVLGWSGRKLEPRWRGSALSRPLLDIWVQDIDDDARSELLALETLHGDCSIGIYRWGGFGFRVLDRIATSCVQSTSIPIGDICVVIDAHAQLEPHPCPDSL